MTCQRLSGSKYARMGRPPYAAESCAGQTRLGNDGQRYVSRPNDKGQYVWVLVPKTRMERVRSTARRAVREYGPAAAEYAAYRAARHLHQKMLPDLNYFNHQLAWDGITPSTYHAG